MEIPVSKPCRGCAPATRVSFRQAPESGKPGAGTGIEVRKSSVRRSIGKDVGVMGGLGYPGGMGTFSREVSIVCDTQKFRDRHPGVMLAFERSGAGGHHSVVCLYDLQVCTAGGRIAHQ